MTTRRDWFRLVALATGLLLALSACGTRGKQEVGGAPSPSPAITPSTETHETVPGATPSPTSSGSTQPSVPVPTVSRSGAGGSVRPADQPRVTPRAAASSSQDDPNVRAPSADRAENGVAAPGSPPPGAAIPAPGVKSVIRIGHVGTLSGPAGATFIQFLHGVQLWVKSANSRGGVNGHQLALFVADDGGDPARNKAETQELVEKQHVLAFVGNVAPLSGYSSVSYLESKRIPLVGTSTGEKWAYDSVMYFPQATSGPALTASLYGSFAQQMVPQGKDKLGVLACTEIQLCRDFYDQAEKEAGRRGMKVVFKGRVTLAQPDFTAECLAARNAGVQVLFLASDGNSQRRVAAACARQGYRPVFATGAQGVLDSFKDDPNLDNSFISNSVTFPVFQDNTPATAEFQEALKRFGASFEHAGGVGIGWVAGKLFEKAAAAISEPPTTEAILEALWAMRGEDLGGLTQPLTFVKDQRPAQTVCWWNVVIAGGRFASPDNFRRTCE